MKGMKKTGAGMVLIGLMMIMGLDRAASANECDPNAAILWLRLGMAIGEESTTPTREELTGLLASLQGPPILAMGTPTDTPLPSTDVSWNSDPAADTFWIRLGVPEARMVYMAIDPTCPYCSQGLQKLAPLISGGQLQVRIILVPFLNEFSAPLAADLMLNENPADAIWRHEITNHGQWQESIDPARVEELGETGRTWLQANLDWMGQRGFNSVPLYVWAETDGKGPIEWKTRTGVQEPDAFMAALPPQEKDVQGFGIPVEIGETQVTTGNPDTETFLDIPALPLE